MDPAVLLAKRSRVTSLSGALPDLVLEISLGSSCIADVLCLFGIVKFKDLLIGWKHFEL